MAGTAIQAYLDIVASTRYQPNVNQLSLVLYVRPDVAVPLISAIMKHPLYKDPENPMDDQLNTFVPS